MSVDNIPIEPPQNILDFIRVKIPTREYDWCAWYIRDGEERCRYGWGKTELEALQDLLNNHEEPE